MLSMRITKKFSMLLKVNQRRDLVELVYNKQSATENTGNQHGLQSLFAFCNSNVVLTEL